MENLVTALLDLDIDWNKLNIEKSKDLEIPYFPSVFVSNEKNLCESSVDLICSIISRPCSG